MLNDDNKPNDDRFDNDQSGDDNELDATRGARRRGVCSHKFKKVGAKLVCSKCGLKRSSGRVS